MAIARVPVPRFGRLGLQGAWVLSRNKAKEMVCPVAVPELAAAEARWAAQRAAQEKLHAPPPGTPRAAAALAAAHAAAHAARPGSSAPAALSASSSVAASKIGGVASKFPAFYKTANKVGG